MFFFFGVYNVNWEVVYWVVKFEVFFKFFWFVGVVVYDVFLGLGVGEGEFVGVDVDDGVVFLVEGEEVEGEGVVI